MSTTQLQLLSEVVQAAVDRYDAETATAPAQAEDAGTSQVDAPPTEVSLSVRLDFAVLLTESERAQLQAPESPLGALPALPPVLYAVWRIRTDVHRAYDLQTVAGYAGLWVWAIRDGRREVDALSTAIDAHRSALQGPASVPSGIKPPVSFPWIAAILWCDRADLQTSYPLTTAESVQGYLSWFIRHGVFELRCGDLLPDDHVALMCAADPAGSSVPLIRYVHFVHGARSDLQGAFDLNEFQGRRAMLKWFFDDGVREYPTHPAIVERQTKVVFEWGQAQKAAAANA